MQVYRKDIVITIWYNVITEDIKLHLAPYNIILLLYISSPLGKLVVFCFSINKEVHVCSMGVVDGVMASELHSYLNLRMILHDIASLQYITSLNKPYGPYWRTLFFFVFQIILERKIVSLYVTRFIVYFTAFLDAHAFDGY